MTSLWHRSHPSDVEFVALTAEQGMTYGFRPENWWTFQQELHARGIAVAEIEKVELRSADSGSSAVVTVTLRSGRVDTWVHEEGSPIR